MYKLFIKRLIDIAICLIGLPFFCVVYIIVAPLIKIEDGGPVFYSGDRLGYKGRVFKMHKFRSMKVNAPDIRNSDGTTYNGNNDPRLTKIGKILRKTSLDEIPQILNVLCGDMSLLGPRAHMARNYEGYDTLTDIQKKRLQVRPGISGYNQAYYRNAASAEEKIEHDIFYVDNLSFILDVKIFFKTIDSVLRRKNIYIGK